MRPERTSASFWIILRHAMLRIAAQDEDGRLDGKSPFACVALC
jgi:hypothetical protein